MRAKNIGELTTITEDEKIPYLNQDLLQKVHESALVRAVNKKVVENYSDISTKFNVLVKFMEEIHPEELKKIFPEEYKDKEKGEDVDGDV